jgi:biopolymer transport protein ExbD
MNWQLPTQKRKDVEIAIVNLVDVIFVLLIFFVMTSTFQKDLGVDVTKPKSSTAKELSKESIMIGVSRQGTLHINESQVSIQSLERILQNQIRENPERAVIIVADRGAPTGQIVDIMDVCNLNKVRKVSLAAESK